MNESLQLKRYPRCLSIAGSDSGGGAGIQADIKTISALGVYATTALTAVTAQNTLGVKAIQAISEEVLAAQIEAVLSDIGTDAVKIGMLHNVGAVRCVVDAIERFSLDRVVLDPVMISTSGHRLIEEETIQAIRAELLPLVTVVTPNVDEAELLAQMAIHNHADLEKAAQRLIQMGCKSVIMKGGHLKGDEAIDTLYTSGNAPITLKVPFIDTQNDHGTGCTFSSAIAAMMAKGCTLEEAFVAAKRYITEALRAGSGVYVGAGHGALNHLFNPIILKANESDFK